MIDIEARTAYLTFGAMLDLEPEPWEKLSERERDGWRAVVRVVAATLPLRLQRLDVAHIAPGDVLLLGADDHLSDVEVERIRDECKRVLPGGAQVGVFDGGIRPLSVLRSMHLIDVSVAGGPLEFIPGKLAQ